MAVYSVARVRGFSSCGLIGDPAQSLQRAILLPEDADARRSQFMPVTNSEVDDAYQAFRPLMFSIAYRMLGSATEAEDLVQEAYLRFHRAHVAGRGDRVAQGVPRHRHDAPRH